MKRRTEITEQKTNNVIYYGIDIEEDGKSLRFIRLTENRNRIEQLKRRLENTDISAVHINDIIRDFIEEDSCDKLLLNSLM